MNKLLKLLGFCDHTYKPDYELYGIDEKTTPLPESFFYFKKCTKCGKTNSL